MRTRYWWFICLICLLVPPIAVCQQSSDPPPGAKPDTATSVPSKQDDEKVFHIGGAVQKPKLLREVPAQFSSEARDAKFSGDVEVYLQVNKDGNPVHIRVVRGVGMGLDEKAVEAVKQYKFAPGTLDGKPVTVDLYIMVRFRVIP